MLINRDNYENYFLLYVDGELCTDDKKSVEDFAAANADLQHELNILKETVLSADDTTFGEKSSLYKTVFIDEALQEKLLLKLDNELPAAELLTLNNLLTKGSDASEEYKLLQQTQLSPDEEIVFSDKQSLYRKERDNVVIGRFFWRAAAAVLIGIGLFVGVSYLRNNNDASTETAGTKPGVVPVKTVAPVPNKQTDIQPKNVQNIAAVKPSAEPAKTKVNVSAPEPGNNNIAVNNAKNNSKEKQVIKKEDPQPNDQLVQQNAPVFQKKNENNLPEPIKINNDHTDPIVKVIPQKKSEVPMDNNIVPLENGYAQAATLKENDRSDNKILYMDEDDVKRSKAGGLFKKVKRFMERTAKIKTGDFRVAGIQLASK